MVEMMIMMVLMMIVLKMTVCGVYDGNGDDDHFVYEDDFEDYDHGKDNDYLDCHYCFDGGGGGGGKDEDDDDDDDDNGDVLKTILMDVD